MDEPYKSDPVLEKDEKLISVTFKVLETYLYKLREKVWSSPAALAKALREGFPRDHPQENELLRRLRLEVRDVDQRPLIFAVKDKEGAVEQFAKHIEEGTYEEWVKEILKIGDFYPTEENMPLTLSQRDGKTTVTSVSGKGMTPEELQRFVEKMQAKGMAPGDLNNGMLDQMIDEVQREDLDLENYLKAKVSLLHITRSYTGEEREKKNAELGGDLQECWSSLERARVISCGTAITDVLSYTDQYLRKHIGKSRPDSVKGRVEEVQQTYFEEQLAALARDTLPYPEKLPFPHTYLSFGTGIKSYDNAEQVADKLMGFLLSENAAWQFFTGTRSREVVLPIGVYHMGHWTSHGSKAPWCIVQLVELINSFKSYVEEVPRSLKRKMDYEKMGKVFGFKKAIPPPYYRVKLHDVHIKERSETSLPSGRVLSHRFDRRGHERCKFLRGKLPLEAKLEAKLIERGYELFKNNPVDVNTFRRLSLRGLPYKAHDEWLAVKTSWVRDCICGDESLPYIPSIHEVPSVGQGDQQ